MFEKLAPMPISYADVAQCLAMGGHNVDDMLVSVPAGSDITTK